MLKLEEVSSIGRTFLPTEQKTEVFGEKPFPMPLLYNTTQKNWPGFGYGPVLEGETPETYTWTMTLPFSRGDNVHHVLTQNSYLMFIGPCIITYEFINVTNEMQILKTLLLSLLYMFRALLAHHQEPN